jgi:hypothetical protein
MLHTRFSHHAKLSAAIIDIEILADYILTNNSVKTVEQRQQLLSFRQSYNAKFQQLAAIAEQALKQAPELKNDVLQSYFANAMADISRTAISHHGQYPAVLVAEDDAGYRASVDALTQKLDAIILWLKQEILPKLPH